MNEKDKLLYDAKAKMQAWLIRPGSGWRNS